MFSRMTNCMVKPLKFSKAMKTFFIMWVVSNHTKVSFDHQCWFPLLHWYTFVHLLIQSNHVTVSSIETKGKVG